MLLIPCEFVISVRKISKRIRTREKGNYKEWEKEGAEFVADRYVHVRSDVNNWQSNNYITLISFLAIKINNVLPYFWKI